MNDTDFLMELSRFAESACGVELVARMTTYANGAIVTASKEPDPMAGRTSAKAATTLYWSKFISESSKRMAETVAAAQAQAEEAEAEANSHKPSPGNAKTTYEEPVTAD